jgi:DNA uptake protein ComE-like DNA-binding protein
VRSDYLLYVVGIVLIAVGGYALLNGSSLGAPMGGMLIFSAVIFVLFLFGVTSLIFGYSQRPKKRQVLSIPTAPVVESLMELTSVKGIGEKRVKQLRALGINTVVDLSTASAEELAEKLQVSSRITNRWIQNARDLLLEK